jgi:pyruvate formate lyase activating enzyme
MAPEREQAVGPDPAASAAGAGASSRRLSRRRFLAHGLIAAGALAGGGGLVRYLLRRGGTPIGADVAEVFRGDAPTGALWEAWRRRGWVVEARHALPLGRNVQCKLCPNNCLLQPGDRGRCRNRVNKDGRLYSMVYGNPCSFGVADPIEKKPLYHFLPGTSAFSLATSGCGFRCLNCQNWAISQRKPEELKDPRGEAFRCNPSALAEIVRRQTDLDPDALDARRRRAVADAVIAREGDRLSMFPQDVVEMAAMLGAESIAYTYSEPTMFYEYMCDTAGRARARGIKNVWVTCGYIQAAPLAELCEVLDAANVDLKSFDSRIYRTLNSGKLQPILDTLKTLKQRGVWFEVTNLVVPTYTDDLEMIRRMCGWLVENLGPDTPLHFSRFHPHHRLSHLPPTPVGVLHEARQAARSAGLHHVYIGNVPGEADAATTWCAGCGKAVVERDGYLVRAVKLTDGRCDFCGRPVAGVWEASAA